jgi:potassium-dependent mechanosensitive channel
MKIFSFTFLLLIFCANVFGQHRDSLPKRPQSSFFANTDTVTRNDYLLSLEKVYQTLNKAAVLSQPVPSILGIIDNLNDDDSAISLIKERLNMNDRSLNIRNLQMMSIILKQINKDSRSYALQLKEYDSIASSFKNQVYTLRKDSLLRQILRDSLLKDAFMPQLVQLTTKWQKTDSILKYVNLLIDNSQARTSNNLITTDELQLQAQSLMKSTGSRAFSKESKYLWEFPKSMTNTAVSTEFKKTIQAERQISGYYFSHTHNQLLLLLVCGLLFFFWIFYNFKSLEKFGKNDTIEPFKFRFINSVPVFASLVFMLNLAPLFDLDAPFIYIASIEFLLMLTLTYSFWKRLPHHLFYLWIFFIVLFLLQSSSRYIGLPVYLNRWLLFILNSLSVLLGLYVLSVFQKDYQQHKFLILSACLYVLFNFLAVLCNVFGRVTLMQILGSTGTYAFIQTAGLLVFIESVTEAFLLQIQSSRMRKEYTGGFDYKEIGKGISKIVIFFSVIIWLIVFATNLNIYNTISNQISDVLNKARSIGSFTFTYGGVILFILIMWAANFLQRYIGYFFGNIGDDVMLDNKGGQRSKLMIVKLVLIIAGFLLAVAASGLAIDKVTVILGALSVGIGLGLQNIVNNFVSGIILIFDRTIHIGDTVEIGDKKGRVKQISMRSSTLLTAEGAEVIIPNGNILSKEFVNWSLNDNYIRIDLTFTVSKISKDLREGILKIIKESPDVAEKEPEILTNTVTSQSTQLKIYFWCEDVTKREIARSEVYTAISKYLEEQGVNIL